MVNMKWLLLLISLPLFGQTCTYTMAHTPGGSILVFRNGIALTPFPQQTDYVWSGNTITIKTFADRDKITVWYTYQRTTGAKAWLPTAEYAQCSGTSDPPPPPPPNAVICGLDLACTHLVSGGTQVDIGPTVMTKAQEQFGQSTLCRDAGAVNALDCSPSPPYAGYATGMVIQVLAANTNTGPVTLTISGLATVAVKRADGKTDLSPGDIVAGRQVALAFDGSLFRIPALSASAPLVRQQVAGIAGIERWLMPDGSEYVMTSAWPDIAAMPVCPAAMPCWAPI